MKMIVSMTRDLWKDQSGASFIEYTVLLGVILAVGVAAISAMGDSAKTVWTNMTTALDKIETGNP